MTSTATYQDAQSDHLRSRPIVVVDSLPQPPLNEERHGAIIDRMEQRILKLPYLGKGITRREFLQRTEGNFTARNEYQTYADTLSNVGVSDRELARNIGIVAGADLLLNLQAYYVPCTYCVDGASAYLVSQVIEAATGKLLLRIDARSHPGPTDQAVGEAFITLEEEISDLMLDAVTPKAHIERFRNLARLRAPPAAKS